MKTFLIGLLLATQVFAGTQKIVTADIVEGTKTVKNYLKNKGHFEKNANGWSAYDDGAATRPVNGTAGTTTTTCTRTTSGALSGDGSMIMTKGAADYQGEGCSVDFTVDTKDKAKVLQVEFDYIVSSGSFTAGTSTTDSDVIVYLYDVTNSVLIEPSTFKLYSSSTTIHDKFIGNFQTASNSTSYRLILHIASSANTSAMVVAFDDFKVSPSNYVYGTPITDWTSYTPTWTASSVNPAIGNGTVSGRWRRVGDSAEINFNIFTGSTTTYGTGFYLVSIPSGFTIDVNKISSGVINDDSGFLGQGVALQAAVTRYNFQLRMYASDTTKMFMAVERTVGGLDTFATANDQITNAIPVTWSGAGNSFSGTMVVPITGWSSSSQQSDGYDGRSIVVVADKAGGAHTSTGNFQDVASWNTARKDSTNSFNSTTGIFTAPSSGDYRVHGVVSLSTNATGIKDLRVYKNSSIMYEISATPSSSDSTAMPFSVTVTNVVAGDTIKLQVYQSSGANLNYAATTAQNTLSIEKLSSPTTISATETVDGTYRTSADVTVNTSTTDIVWNTKIDDSHGSMNTSTGVGTVPHAGKYFFDITGRLDASGPVPGEVQIQLVVTGKNAGTYVLYDNNALTASKIHPVHGAIGLSMNGGDTFKISAISTTNSSTLKGGSSLYTAFSWFKIK